MAAEVHEPMQFAECEQFEIDPATLRAMQEAREGIGIPLEEVAAWVESWDTDNELPKPVARKLY